MHTKVLSTATSLAFLLGAGFIPAQTVDLPTSKQLIGEVPGVPQRLNSLPITMAISPDRRYVVTVNAGYGTFESQYEQSLAVLDTQTGVLTDYPDSRTLAKDAKQTLYSGLAFSRDGTRIYATMGSTSSPLGDGKDKTGNGVIVYSFIAGKIAPESFIRLPLQQLAPGRKTRLIGEAEGDKGIPFPAAIAVAGPSGPEKLLVADNLSDDVLLINPSSGAVERRFDLSESDAVPGTYPVALAVAKDGERAFVALWNASEIVEINLTKGVVARKLALLKPPSTVPPELTPAHSSFLPMEKLSTWRSPTAMPLPPSM